MFWRIHQAIFKDRTNEAVEHINTFGDTVQVIDGHVLFSPSVPQVTPHQPALAMTTLQDAKQQMRAFQGDCTPWLFYHDEYYAVSYWMPHIETDIPVLNDTGIFCPVGKLSRMDSGLLSVLAGDEGKVFIKPDKGHKAFTGFSMPVTDWPRSIMDNPELMKQDPHVMCFLAPHKPMQDVEWRFWIVNRLVIAWSPYSWKSDVRWMHAPEQVMHVAQSMAKNQWQPDLAYVVDVGLDTDGNAFLIELNAASTSGIYDAPLALLLSGLRDVCHQEFEGELTL